MLGDTSRRVILSIVCALFFFGMLTTDIEFCFDYRVFGLKFVVIWIVGALLFYWLLYIDGEKGRVFLGTLMWLGVHFLFYATKSLVEWFNVDFKLTFICLVVSVIIVWILRRISG